MELCASRGGPVPAGQRKAHARKNYGSLHVGVPGDIARARHTTVRIKTSAAAVEYGHPLTLTATVTPAAATGKVTFYKGTTILEIEPLANGTATFTTRLLSSGAQSFRAYYGGDVNYSSSSSKAVLEDVRTVPAKSFGAPVLGPSSYYQGIAVGDFNDDGILDLAVPSGAETGAVGIFLGKGDGTFQEPVDYDVAAAYGIAVGDFNGDGIADLAVGSSVGPHLFSVLLGNGDGTFQNAVNIGSGSIQFPSIAVADFNGDGKADRALADYSANAVDVFLGNGNGTFQPSVNVVSSISPSGIVIGDFNGDGKADIAVTYATLVPSTYGVSVLMGNGDGTFQPPSNTTLSSSGGPLAVADFNLDGKSDLAVTVSDGTAVLLGIGDGTFQNPVYYVDAIPTYYLSSIVVCDFNGDGKADLISSEVLSDVDYVIDVLLGNGDGTFQTPVSSPSRPQSSFVVADFNGDGRADVAGVSFQAPLSVQLGSTLQPTVTVLSSSPNPSIYGQKITLTANVSPSTSEGEVTFYTVFDSTIKPLGTAILNAGTATFTLLTDPGSYSLEAVYSGDADALPSTSNLLSQQVNPVPTSITLTSTPNPSTVGQSVTLVAEVKPAAATGTVTFYNGAEIVGAVAVFDGTATLSASTLPQGSDSLTASYYSGNILFLPSVSSALIQLVQ